jgi:hypothetical protein
MWPSTIVEASMTKAAPLPMTDRKTLLGKLVVGDVFHATDPKGASLICLTVAVTEATIQARRVTTQEHLEFDQQTGIEECGDKPSKIDSVAPLPFAVLNVILGIDRKYRLLQDPEQGILTDGEIRALAMYVGPHFASKSFVIAVEFPIFGEPAAIIARFLTHAQCFNNPLMDSGTRRLPIVSQTPGS